MQRQPVRSIRWVKWAITGIASWPAFQLAGCSIFDPQNIARIAFDALLIPLNDQVFNLFSSFTGGV